jgi:kynurenine formamidase
MPPSTRKAGVAACFCLLWTSSATAVEFGEGVWVDLSHEFSEDMAGHPRSQPFVHTPGVVGMTRGGFYMATYNYSGSEHVGTHMDAPVHFHEGGKSIDQVSIDRLMGEVIVVNVQAQVADDPNYLVSVDDVLNWEQANGPMPDDCIVMFNTGLANVWPDPLKYVGTDKTGNEGVVREGAVNIKIAEQYLPGTRLHQSLLTLQSPIQHALRDAFGLGRACVFVAAKPARAKTEDEHQSKQQNEQEVK